MKRITKQETLPALAVPEVLSVPELAYPARLGKRAVVQVLRKADVKKAALAVGGTALVLSAIGAAGKRQFYKRIVASELKRQLAVVNGKLDNLQAQNEALRAELGFLSFRLQVGARVRADGVIGLLADVVLDLAGVLLRGPGVHAEGDEEGSERFVAVEHFGGDGHAGLRERDESILIHRDVPALLETARGVGDARLCHAEVLRHVNGANVSVLELHHQHGLEIVLRRA